MKVVLINPVSKLIETSNILNNFLKPIPPLGLAYIAGVLELDGITVKIIDQCAQGLSNDALVQFVLKEDPDLIGFSCLTPVISNTVSLIKQIRQAGSAAKIVLGNIHPTLFAAELLEKGYADIVVRGEGEYSMLELTQALRDGRGLEGIKGISFAQNGAVYHNADRGPVEPLDKLPYPAWHLLDLAKYDCFQMLGIRRRRFLTVSASRGCLYNCMFCAQEKMHKKPRYRAVESVLDEISFMYERYGIDLFVFNDAFFPFSAAQGLEFCDAFIKRGLHKRIKWICECRVDQVNRELLRRMKEAGVYLVMYGFEVGTQRVLDILHKNTTLAQALEASRLTREAGIYSVGLFIIGVPGETKSECDETIRFALKLNSTIGKFNIVVPYPGTALFKEHKDSFYTEDAERFISWLDWSARPGKIVHVSDTMKAEELVRLQRKAMFKYYFRPAAFLRLKKFVSWKDMLMGGYVLTRQLCRSLQVR